MSNLHKDMVVIDGTCPLLDDFDYISWWIEGGATAAAPTVGGFSGAAATLRHIGEWHHYIATHSELVLVCEAADIVRAKHDGKFGIILHFQGTEPLEDSLDLIDAYKALGIGIVQLAYNVRNRIGDGCEEPSDAGLSRFGRKVIARMNEARVLIDCSHTGYHTTMDAIAASTAPVVFSHANAKAVHANPRNIADDQAKAVAATGGWSVSSGFRRS